LKEHYTHILTEETKNRYFIQNDKEMSKLGTLYKDNTDEYKRHAFLHSQSRWSKNDIKDDLTLLHSEKVDYLQGKETPEESYEEFDDDFVASISPDTLFVVQIFAMKYKIEIPILQLINVFPEGGKPITNYEYTIYVYNSEGDPEIIHQDAFDTDELSKRFKFILVAFNS